MALVAWSAKPGDSDYGAGIEHPHHGLGFHTPDCSPVYIPSIERHFARQQRLYPLGGAKPSLPEGFPSRSTHSSVWSGEQTGAEDFSYRLSGTETLEIQAALIQCLTRKIRVEDVSPLTFPLPKLGLKLQALKPKLWDKGLVILKGLDPVLYTLEENIILYLGITSYVSSWRGVQGVGKDFIVHMRGSPSLISAEQPQRKTHKCKAQAFHTDHSQILTDYVMNIALEGGRCFWSSSATVYNELAESRPEVLNVLAQSDWPFEYMGGDGSYYRRQILFMDHGRPLFFFSRQNLTGSARFRRSPLVPPITDVQADALDALHFAALKHSIQHLPDRGEIHLVHNLAVLQAREDFVDADDVRDGRHLMRLWLKSDEDGFGALPDHIKDVFHEIYGPDSLARGKWDLGGVNSIFATTDDAAASSS